MAFFHSPRTVTDGLVLALDAANPKSYPGSGTTWYDKSGNGNNGTLINGPTFDSGDGGSIVFDGTDDWVVITDTPKLNLTGSQVSVCVWVKHTTTGQYQALILKDLRNSNSVGWNLFISSPESGTKSRWGVSTSNGFNYMFGVNSLVSNTWYNIVGTYDGSKIYLYENGILVNSQNCTGNIVSSAGTDVYIGSRGQNRELLEGNLSISQIYDKTLSASEVLQNYNAIKGRFGL